LLLRIAALDSEDESKTPNYDKEKYREMILDAAETVLGTFGFERTVYGDSKRRKRKWWQELVQERKQRLK
jgi:predicted secreted acid phosphatase